MNYICWKSIPKCQLSPNILEFYSQQAFVVIYRCLTFSYLGSLNISSIATYRNTSRSSFKFSILDLTSSNKSTILGDYFSWVRTNCSNCRPLLIIFYCYPFVGLPVFINSLSYCYEIWSVSWWIVLELELYWRILGLRGESMKMV